MVSVRRGEAAPIRFAHHTWVEGSASERGPPGSTGRPQASFLSAPRQEMKKISEAPRPLEFALNLSRSRVS